MTNPTATRTAIWKEFSQTVIAADVAAGIESPIINDARLAKLAFLRLYEKYLEGEWDAGAVMRSINDHVLMPAGHILSKAATPDSTVNSGELQHRLFDLFYAYGTLGWVADDCLAEVYTLLRRPTRTLAEKTLRAAEDLRDEALLLTVPDFHSARLAS